jgi:hypothetical protein
VARTDHHTFIYKSAISAIIVPRDTADEGDCHTFVAALQLSLQGSKSPKSPPSDGAFQKRLQDNRDRQ